jgi:hypothetical protein
LTSSDPYLAKFSVNDRSPYAQGNPVSEVRVAVIADQRAVMNTLTAGEIDFAQTLTTERFPELHILTASIPSFQLAIVFADPSMITNTPLSDPCVRFSILDHLAASLQASETLASLYVGYRIEAIPLGVGDYEELFGRNCAGDISSYARQLVPTLEIISDSEIGNLAKGSLVDIGIQSVIRDWSNPDSTSNPVLALVWLNNEEPLKDAKTLSTIWGRGNALEGWDDALTIERMREAGLVLPVATLTAFWVAQENILRIFDSSPEHFPLVTPSGQLCFTCQNPTNVNLSRGGSSACNSDCGSSNYCAYTDTSKSSCECRDATYGKCEN